MFGLNDMLEQPWALEPSRLSRIAAQLARPDAERAAMTHEALGPVSPTRIGPVSVIPVLGVISHRPGLESLFGMGTSVEEIRAHLRTELNDPSVKAVVLDIDSPGGTVAGIPELATEIRAMRDRQPQKPIIGVANTTAASAAYWLGAQATELYVTPSGSVGSVGIYAVHQEGSRAMEAEGITTTVVGIPDAKIDANEWSPLSEEARAHIESRAKEFYAQFIGDVAAGRRVALEHVEGRFGGGRMLLAKAAKAAGMVDGVATLDATISRLFKAYGGGAAPKRSALRALEHQLVGDLGTAAPAAQHFTIGELGSETVLSGTGTATVTVGPDVTVSTTLIEPDPDEAAPEERELHGETDDDGWQARWDALPFSVRLEAVAEEALDLVTHAQERARLRAKESRPPLSTTSEQALRSIRGAIDDLLALVEPEPDVAAAPEDPPAPPVAPALQPSLGSDANWAAYLAQEYH